MNKIVIPYNEKTEQAYKIIAQIALRMVKSQEKVKTQ